MNGGADDSTAVLVIGTSRDAQALARHLSAEHEVHFASDRAALVDGAKADGMEASALKLDGGSELGALDLAVDAAIVATSRDRTNLLVVQHLRARSDVSQIVVRVNDPDREDAFGGLGVETICSTEILAPEISARLEPS